MILVIVVILVPILLVLLPEPLLLVLISLRSLHRSHRNFFLFSLIFGVMVLHMLSLLHLAVKRPQMSLFMMWLVPSLHLFVIFSVVFIFAIPAFLALSAVFIVVLSV